MPCKTSWQPYGISVWNSSRITVEKIDIITRVMNILSRMKYNWPPNILLRSSFCKYPCGILACECIIISLPSQCYQFIRLLLQIFLRIRLQQDDFLNKLARDSDRQFYIYCRTGKVRVCDFFANTRTSIALANLAHAINYIHGNATHHWRWWRVGRWIPLLDGRGLNEEKYAQ